MFNRKGFTLIELLIVVVIIGILAAIAIPKFAATKQKAYLASMKSDLRNLATAQEGYFADNTAYFAGAATNPASLPTGCTAGTDCLFTPSAGVTVTAALGATGGWSATATHAQLAGRTCAIFVSPATAVAPATVEGEPRCN
jgi:prepilin-type N-terminal cleavage/methylation domain-containing protein